jgi:N12 class adenine-specific DNA methylase
MARRGSYKSGIDPGASDAERLPLFAELIRADDEAERMLIEGQIRAEVPGRVESVGEENRNDGTETRFGSIREGSVRESEGIESEPAGRGTQADSPERVRSGGGAVREDGGVGDGSLGSEGADPERPEQPGRPHGIDAASIDGTETSAARVETSPPLPLHTANYEITDPDAIVQGGKKSKLDANLAAIRLLKELQTDGRTPTKEEQDALGRFTGWGQFPELFNDLNEAGQKLTSEREELKGLLGEQEYERAKRSTLNAHYTSPQVVKKMWEIARKIGFKSGRVLEPAMGVGYFYGLMPRDLMAQSKLAGVEIDPTTGAIARKLYPNASINVKGFQEVRIADGFYDLVIGNVPFGDFRVHDPAYNKYRANIHDYFILKSLDKTRAGGVVAFITSTGTLDKANPKIRQEIAKRGDLIAAMRFPEGTHEKNAGTAVVTDLLIFRRRAEREQGYAVEKTSGDYASVKVDLKGEAWVESVRQRLDENGIPIDDASRGVGVDRIQNQLEWNGELPPADSDIRALAAHGLSQESPTVWITPLAKDGPPTDWTRLGLLPDPDGGESIPINNYYVRNPEMILGRLDRKSRMYGSGEPHVSPTVDFAERIDRAITSLPENVIGEFQARLKEPKALSEAVGESVVEGGYILRDGRILQRQGDVYVAPSFTPAEEGKVKLLIPVRDALNALNAAQLKGEDTAAPRRELNGAYDLFVSEYGPIRKSTNAKLLAKDPSSYLLLALETSYDPKTQKAAKADIFTQDTITRTRQARDVSTPAEAIAINLFETGRPDIDRIAELLNSTPEEAGKQLVAKGLAFENPQGAWETAEKYLSGNVRKKLAEAREAAEVDDRYWPNIEALEKVQPEDVPMEMITVKLGAGWVPAGDIRDFAGHLMQTDPEDFRIAYSEAIGVWSVSCGNFRVSKSDLAREVYGTDRANFVSVLDAALNDRPIKIYDRSGDEAVLNKAASDLANEKVREARDQFADWVWGDDKRAERLHRYYNDTYNNIRVIEYAGMHYANQEGKFVLPGMNPNLSLRPNQIKDVWQAVANGKLLDASEVGAGKTFILGAIAMEWKCLGIASKPAIAVPKPRIAATVGELQTLYPAAKILSLENSFDKENRKRTTGMMATGNYDMIVLSHEQLDKMPMSPEVTRKFIGAEIEEIEASIVDAKMLDGGEGDSGFGNRVVKRLEKMKERAEAKLQEALEPANKDDVIYFEQSGIDALLVDEAHAFKSLPVYSRHSEIKGIPTTRSDRATSMYMRAQWLMEQNNNSGVVFATGTPVTNTLAEVYNMQRYLQPELLAERGIENFDAWASLFADVATEFEYTASGEYKAVSRMTEFVNLPELQQMVRQIMATNFVDDMTWLARPQKIEQVITSPMTDGQLEYLKEIRDRVEELKRMSPMERRASGENFLLISTDARKSSLSPRLIDPDATESGSKIEKVAEKALEIHRARPGVTQMIFIDYGVNPNKWGYSVYDDIQDRLVAGGIPKERIANFGRMGDAARQKAAEKLNAGEYLVGIGSSGKMGTGINAQQRLAAMHHVDAPWLPALVEQRNGRGHRQGNMNDPAKPAGEQTVEAYYYTTEGSFDVVMWQALSRKGSFIREFMRGDLSVREMRMEDTGDEGTGELGPEIILAATSGNPYELDRIKLIKDIERLDRMARGHRQQQSRFRAKIADAGRKREALESDIANYTFDAARYGETKGREFSVEINGKTYSDRKAAGNQLAIAVVEAPMRENKKIGRYRGFDLFVEKFNERPFVYLTESGPQYTVALKLDEPETAFNSADANLRQAEARRVKAVDQLESLDRDVETAKAEVDKPFKRAEELEEKRQKLGEIQQKIEELYDQRPGREVRKLAGRLENIEPSFATVINGAAHYDLGAVRSEMADVVPERAVFDRWVLALQNVGIVRLHEADGVSGREAEVETQVQNPQTGRQFAKISFLPNWEEKAANVPSVAAFIEVEVGAPVLQETGKSESIPSQVIESYVRAVMSTAALINSREADDRFSPEERRYTCEILMDQHEELVGAYKTLLRWEARAEEKGMLDELRETAAVALKEKNLPTEAQWVNACELQALCQYSPEGESIANHLSAFLESRDIEKAAPSVQADREILGNDSTHPIAALQQIADLERNNPDGTRSWKELAQDAGGIAREVLTKLDPSQAAADNLQVAALEKIAALAPIDSNGVRHSWKELAGGVMETARQTLTETSTSIKAPEQSIEARIQPQGLTHEQSLGGD